MWENRVKKFLLKDIEQTEIQKVRGEILLIIVCPHCGYSNDIINNFVGSLNMSFSCGGHTCEETLSFDFDSFLCEEDAGEGEEDTDYDKGYEDSSLN